MTVNGKQLAESYLPSGTETFPIASTKVPAKHVYVLGDNRSNSQGSNSFGPVPYENVKAIVVVRWWPLGSFGGF